VVIWTEPTKVDLRSIHDFIATDSRYYAKKVVQDIAAKTDILASMPRIGRKVTEIDDDNILELLPYSYLALLPVL
jgi:toxin ParE1/3/4